jgi:hypothetical protein
MPCQYNGSTQKTDTKPTEWLQQCAEHSVVFGVDSHADEHSKPLMLISASFGARKDLATHINTFHKLRLVFSDPPSGPFHPLRGPARFFPRMALDGVRKAVQKDYCIRDLLINLAER